jgi:hypothetical protein
MAGGNSPIPVELCIQRAASHRLTSLIQNLVDGGKESPHALDRPVIDLAAALFPGNETALPQTGQMLARIRLREARLIDDVNDTLLTAKQAVEDL